MFRKIISILCIAALFLSMNLAAVPANAESTAVRSRKIVSVVYDDSGSMSGEKWEYTSYAMQCFAAMLNKEDRLDITYMSSYSKGSYSVDTNDRAAAVKAIRNHTDSNDTPVDSIDTAFSALKGHNDTNVNTQYWLIVMTDGQMVGKMSAEDKINSKAEETMPNGSKPHIVFLTICDSDGSYTPSFNKSNITSKSAKTAADINRVISGIASDISGRYAVAAEDIRVIDGKTVEVSTDLPLINMGILTQRSSARVVNVAGAKSQNLQEECNIAVAAPGLYTDELTPDDAASLTGNVALYHAATGNIPAGKYTLSFSENISKDDLVIMFEPAFELRLEVFSGKDRIDDLTQLVEDSTVDIEASLYEIGTDNRILPSMLPSDGQSTITLTESGVDVQSQSSLRLEEVVLKGVETRVTATLEIPGYFTVRDTITFKPEIVKLSDMTATVHYDGSERLKDKNGNPDAENVVYITELKENGTGVKFTLYIQDQPIDKSRATAIKDEFAKSLRLDFDNFKVSVSDDGSLIVAPKSTRVPALIYWLLHRGDNTIESSYGDKTASDMICFKMGDWKEAIMEFLTLLLVIFLILYLLCWIFLKKHFRKNGTIKVFVARSKNTGYSQDYGKTARIHWLAASGIGNFLGLRGMRKKIRGTKFYVRVSKAGYVLENVKGLSVSTNYPYPNPNAGYQKNQKNTHAFSSNIYVNNETGYYKISIS